MRIRKISDEFWNSAGALWNRCQWRSVSVRTRLAQLSRTARHSWMFKPSLPGRPCAQIRFSKATSFDSISETVCVSNPSRLSIFFGSASILSRGTFSRCDGMGQGDKTTAAAPAHANNNARWRRRVSARLERCVHRFDTCRGCSSEILFICSCSSLSLKCLDLRRRANRKAVLRRYYSLFERKHHVGVRPCSAWLPIGAQRYNHNTRRVRMEREALSPAVREHRGSDFRKHIQ